jgi:hypothetical protein
MELTGSTYQKVNKVVEIDRLCRGDRVSVQTLKSRYQFSVLDPSTRKGTLTGGVLGDRTLDAILSGTVSEDSADADSRELKIGARAVFFLDLKDRAQRLTTSLITDLTLV